MARLTETLVPLSYVLAAFVFLASCALTVLGRLWVTPLGNISSVGLASISVLYVLSEHRFRSLGVASPTRSVVLALLFANAFLQSYEIIYGLSFLPAMTGAELRTIILWFLMVSPLVLMRDYLRFKWTTSFFLLALFAMVWAVWLLFGFPQYYSEGLPFAPILRTADLYITSLWLNFGSKAILAAFYASLLEPLKSLRELVHWRGKPTRSELR